MDMKEICPCHNLDCPNHGYCEKCISRHLRIGSLNYCAFHTVLPTLQEAIDTSPESPTAKKLASMIGNTQEIYGNLMEKHGLSKERQERLLKMVTDFSDY
jgi:hypothetical protein